MNDSVFNPFSATTPMWGGHNPQQSPISGGYDMGNWGNFSQQYMDALNTRNELAKRQLDIQAAAIEDQQGFGWNKFSNLMGGIGSLASAYTGLQGLKEIKRQSSFNRDLARTNLANQSSLLNADLQNRERMRAQAQGRTYDPSQIPVLRGTI